MRQLLSQFCALILVAAVAGPATAQRRPPTRADGRIGPPARPIWQELGLSPGQRQRLKELHRGRRFDLRRMTQELMEKRRELADLYRAYPLDEARANSLIERITQLETQRLRYQLQNQLELRRILNREQFGRFSEKVEPGPRRMPPAGRATGP